MNSILSVLDGTILFGCGSSETSTNPAGSGGALGVGGTQSTGGTTVTGGLSSTGEANTGGVVQLGGQSNGTGGIVATGGALATGGAKATGGAVATGGNSSEGSAKSSGGTLSTGGAEATGSASLGVGEIPRASAERPQVGQARPRPARLQAAQRWAALGPSLLAVERAPQSSMPRRSRPCPLTAPPDTT